MVLVAALGCSLPTPEPSPTPACFNDEEVRYLREVSRGLEASGGPSATLAELFGRAESDVSLTLNAEWQADMREALLEWSGEAVAFGRLEAPESLAEYRGHIVRAARHIYEAAAQYQNGVDTLDNGYYNAAAAIHALATEEIAASAQWVVDYCERS